MSTKYVIAIHIRWTYCLIIDVVLLETRASQHRFYFVYRFIFVFRFIYNYLYRLPYALDL